MPLDGSDVASKPVGTTFAPNTTIQSSKVNSVLDDIYAIFNSVRSIAKGYTGASTAIGASDNLNTTSANIASATTTDLSTASGVVVNITGTTTITGLGTVASGAQRVLIFAGALTLTHNATSLILPGGANITTASGDIATFRSKGSGNWVCTGFQRAASLPGVGDVTLTGTQTLTNKTLTSPTINSPTFGGSVPAGLDASTTAKGISEFATAAEYRTGTDTARSLVVSEVWSSGALVTLTDAATIAVDMATFINANVTLGGNRALGNPTNTKVGQSGFILITQDGTGSRTLSFGSSWRFAGGIDPVLSTAAASNDMLFYSVVNSTFIVANLVKGAA